MRMFRFTFFLASIVQNTRENTMLKYEKMLIKIFLVCLFVFQLLLSLQAQNEVQTVCIKKTGV